MTILQAENLIREYGPADNPVRAVNNITLSIDEGEFAAVTGPSGSGKSTLLYLLAGIERPTSGRVLFKGRNLKDYSEKEAALLRRRDTAFIYQFYNLIPNLTVEENILLPKRLNGKINTEDMKFMRELAGYAGITHVLGRRPSEISGGEQQRAAIVRAVNIRPAVIFADEPAGNLDSASGERVMQLLSDMNREYKSAVVMVTHSPTHAAMASRIIRIKDGRLEQE